MSSALSHMTNGMGSPVSGESLSTGGYSTPEGSKPLYRVSNTHPVKIHNQTWHERPPVLNTFTSIPDGKSDRKKHPGSYPQRSMGVEEAVRVVPIIAVLLDRGRAEVRHTGSGVQVSVTDHHRHSKGLNYASSGRRQWQKTLNRDDWEKVQEFLADPSVAAIIGKLPATLSPLDAATQEFQAIIEAGTRRLFGDDTNK